MRIRCDGWQNLASAFHSQHAQNHKEEAAHEHLWFVGQVVRFFIVERSASKGETGGLRSWTWSPPVGGDLVTIVFNAGPKNAVLHEQVQETINDIIGDCLLWEQFDRKSTMSEGELQFELRCLIDSKQIEERHLQALMSRLNISVFEEVDTIKLAKWLRTQDQKSWVNYKPLETSHSNQSVQRRRARWAFGITIWLIACAFVFFNVADSLRNREQNQQIRNLRSFTMQLLQTTAWAAAPSLLSAIAVIVAWPPILVWSHFRKERYQGGILSTTFQSVSVLRNNVRLLVGIVTGLVCVVLCLYWWNQLDVIRGTRSAISRLVRIAHVLTQQADQLLIGMQQMQLMINNASSIPSENRSAAIELIVDIGESINILDLQGYKITLAKVRWMALFGEQLLLTFTTLYAALVFLLITFLCSVVSLSFTGIYKRRPITFWPVALLCIPALAALLCCRGFETVVANILKSVVEQKQDISTLLPQSVQQNAPIIAITTYCTGPEDQDLDVSFIRESLLVLLCSLATSLEESGQLDLLAGVAQHGKFLLDMKVSDLQMMLDYLSQTLIATQGYMQNAVHEGSISVPDLDQTNVVMKMNLEPLVLKLGSSALDLLQQVSSLLSCDIVRQGLQSSFVVMEREVLGPIYQSGRLSLAAGFLIAILMFLCAVASSILPNQTSAYYVCRCGRRFRFNATFQAHMRLRERSLKICRDDSFSKMRRHAFLTSSRLFRCNVTILQAKCMWALIFIATVSLIWITTEEATQDRSYEQLCMCIFISAGCIALYSFRNFKIFMRSIARSVFASWLLVGIIMSALYAYNDGKAVQDCAETVRLL